MQDERRRSDDKNWEEIKSFISESREYRATDAIRQSYVKEKIDDISEQVRKTNGRVDKLEDFQTRIEDKIRNKKEASDNWQGRLAVGSGCIAALAAIWAIFKK